MSQLPFRVMGFMTKTGLSKVVVGLVPVTVSDSVDYFPTVLGAWRGREPAPVAGLDALANLVWDLATTQHERLDRPVIVNAGSSVTVPCTWQICDACSGWLDYGDGTCYACYGFGHLARPSSIVYGRRPS